MEGGHFALNAISKGSIVEKNNAHKFEAEKRVRRVMPFKVEKRFTLSEQCTCSVIDLRHLAVRLDALRTTAKETHCVVRG